MAIKIITDSAADFELNEAKELDLTIVSIILTIENKTYLNWYDLTKDEFYEILRKTKFFPKTSQPAPEIFADLFAEAKEKGDTVIAILLSGGLSGTVQSAEIAKELVGYEKIHIIDSLGAVASERMLVEKAVQMRDENKTAEDIIMELAYMKKQMCVYAMVDTLEYLHRGGRLTKTQARIGTLLNLKPLITINEVGKLEVFDKCMGRSRAYAAIIRQVEKKPIDYNYPVYFTYSYGVENCEMLIAKMQKLYPLKAVFPLPQIGPTIGAHLGPGAFGIIYISKEKI